MVASYHRTVPQPQRVLPRPLAAAVALRVRVLIRQRLGDRQPQRIFVRHRRQLLARRRERAKISPSRELHPSASHEFADTQQGVVLQPEQRRRQALLDRHSQRTAACDALLSRAADGGRDGVPSCLLLHRLRMGTHGRLELTLLSRRPAGLIGSVVIARLRRRRHGRGRSRRSHRSFLATTCGCLLQLQLMLRSALIPLLTFSLCRSLLRVTALQLLKLTPSCVGTPLLLFCKGRNACRLELSGDCIFVCPRPWRLRRRSWSRILNVQPDSESIPIHSDNLELCFSRHGAVTWTTQRRDRIRRKTGEQKQTFVDGPHVPSACFGCTFNEFKSDVFVFNRLPIFA